jgi:pilus assembly protein CpaB
MGRMRGCLWLTAGLAVALVAAVVGYMTLSRAASTRAGAGAEATQVDVVVAAGQVPVRAVLAAENLRVQRMAGSAAPEGSLQQPSQAIGKITAVALYPGEVILSQRLVDPNVTAADGRTALVLDGDRVLIAFPADDLMSKVGVLKPGDHVDLLVTLDFPAVRGAGGGQGAEPATFSVLQNLTIAATVGLSGSAQGTQNTGGSKAAQNTADANAPPALLLTVSPQDALTLKYVKDAGGRIDVVLRAPGAEGPFNTEPVDWNYLIDKFQIPAGAGR